MACVARQLGSGGNACDAPIEPCLEVVVVDREPAVGCPTSVDHDGLDERVSEPAVGPDTTRQEIRVAGAGAGVLARQGAAAAQEAEGAGQYGDVGWAQERLIAAFAERSPAESRTMIRRWTLTLLAAGIVLAVVGAALYLWSVVAGVVAHVVAAVVLVLWWRIHRQREALETMADTVGGGGGGRRAKR